MYTLIYIIDEEAGVKIACQASNITEVLSFTGSDKSTINDVVVDADDNYSVLCLVWIDKQIIHMQVYVSGTY